MAEEQAKTNGAVNGAAEKTKKEEQQFTIERIYIKDISFEAPEDHYEVELHLNVTVKNKSDESTAFLVEAVQAGAFSIKGYSPDQLNHLLASYCPGQLFPYAREVISNLVSKGSFPEMHLSPINFDALYAKNLAQQHESAKAKESAKVQKDA